MARALKLETEMARNAGFSAYPTEIIAITKVARRKKFKAPFDYVRSLVIADDHPAARRKIAEPRRLKIRAVNPDRSRGPSSPRQPQV